MQNMIRYRKGFTLIELLIVIAVIGILAAVAIPLFASYRIKGYNSNALSDLKMLKVNMEAMHTDHNGYPGGL